MEHFLTIRRTIRFFKRNFTAWSQVEFEIWNPLRKLCAKKHCWLEHAVISTGKFLSAFFHCGVTLKYTSISFRTGSHKFIYVYIFVGYKRLYYFEIWTCITVHRKLQQGINSLLTSKKEDEWQPEIPTGIRLT